MFTVTSTVGSERTRSGFTLIELLVTISIIAILASILFPVFARARENARRASCQSNLKQIALGLLQYTQDYDEIFPQVARIKVGSESPLASYTLGSDRFAYFTWVDGIEPYVKSGQVFHCPSDSALRYMSGDKFGQISYGMNSYFSNYNPSKSPPGPRVGYTEQVLNTGALPLAALYNPAHKILVGDVYKGSGYTGPLLRPTLSTYNNQYYRWPLDMQFDQSTIWGAQAINTFGAKTAHGRHLGGANIAFADGHVKFYPATTVGLMFADIGSYSKTDPYPNSPTNSVPSDEFIKFWMPLTDTPY